ncbi:glycine/betaine ABC transporter substrate-binding protein [Amphritea opalescens]|uniref:Glycine/betaine ABC transporter substrate-binding protein n=1 Tax=Amphritea opalescens TaxID=2490544 RepID=A0A430KV04_9GAMM|nr:glycine betaine ABC transporter substrate-binding protein [Amphritea opalescens]RTE67322.1 glycine/betaine ABC transporter substrate-binding protein [Amphritea opalescens]
MIIKKTLKTIAIACLSLTTLAQASELTLGSKAYTEQLLVAEMTSQLLEHSGYTIDKKSGMGGSLLRKAMENGQIDICWEYTGTSLVTYNKVKERLSPEDTYQRVKMLDAKKGIVWLNPSKANNTYALAIRDNTYENINSISDLAGAYNSGEALKLGSGPEFPKRLDGLRGLTKTYGFKVKRDDIVTMQTGLVYDALREGEVDIAVVFATDGRNSAFNFKVLKDDLQYFPNYALTPTLRKEVMDANPGLADLLNDLSSRLNDKTVQRLNGEIAVHHKSVEAIAEAFLKEQNLI